MGKSCPMFRLVDASKTIGPGATRNAGARAAKGELMAFCDADDVVQPGWLAGHMTALATADLVGGVSITGLSTVWSRRTLLRLPCRPP
jgi:glycosyltransferase involved in cell wall biosynthesis